MPEILGYSLGGAGDIPCEIFEGDHVLGRIFDKVFNDKESPLYQGGPDDEGHEHIASPETRISDGEELLDLLVNSARKIRQSREDHEMRAGRL